MSTAPSRAPGTRLVITELPDGTRHAPDPHLARPPRPSPADLAAAVAVLGMFPDGSYLAGELRVSLLTLTGGSGHLQCDELDVPAPNPACP